MPDALRPNSVLEQRVIDRVGEWQVVQLKKARRDEGKRVGGRQPAILIQPGPSFGKNLGCQAGAALRLRFQKMEALGLSGHLAECQ